MSDDIKGLKQDVSKQEPIKWIVQILLISTWFLMLLKFGFEQYFLLQLSESHKKLEASSEIYEHRLKEIEEKVWLLSNTF